MRTDPKCLEMIGSGGLSGKPIRGISTALVRKVYRLTEGKKPIMGCGGVFTAEDAWEKIMAGASVVQVLTGMVYEGPGAAYRIKRGLLRKLDKYGLDNIGQAVGMDA
jgi:dihydroorotate dehydrogenase